MLLTNHVLTGIVLGLVIDNPVILAPTAVASHLVLDMTPHFGYEPIKGQLRAPMFIVLGAIDFAASAVIVVAACLAVPQRTANMLIGAVGAALPDLSYLPVTFFGDWVYRLLPWYRPMIAFLGKIQWYEKAPGLLSEAGWAAVMLYCFQRLL